LENFDIFIAPCPKCGELLKVRHTLSTVPIGRNITVLNEVQLTFGQHLINLLILININSKCESCGEDEILIMIHNNTFFGFRLLTDYDFDGEGCENYFKQCDFECEEEYDV
jgi:hypothetical protein